MTNLAPHRRWVLAALLAAAMTGCTIEVLLPGVGVERVPEPDAAIDAPSREPVEAPPGFQIDGVEPTQGPAEGGIRVRITGQRFAQGATVRFADTLAVDALWLGEDALDVEVPPGEPGLADVTVENPDGATTVLKGGFRYLGSTRIDGVFPASGPLAGGTPITVTGAGFLPDSVLLVGGRLALKTQRVDGSTLVGLTPGGPVGPSDLYVVHEAGAARRRDAWLYQDPPRIESVFPPNGHHTGGNVVNLIGSGLASAQTVTFGGSDAAIVATWGDDTLTVLAPPGTPGPTDIQVTTPWASGLLERGYVWLEPSAPDGLALIAAVPQSGPDVGGTLVTLTAYGATTAQAVRFGAATAEIVGVDAASHTLLVRAPASPWGLVDIVAEGPEGSSTLAGAFRFTPSIAVTDVTPATGPAAGGTTVDVTGTGFTPEMELRVGPLACSGVQILGPTQARAVTAVGSPGPSDVGVTLGGAAAVLPGAYEFAASSAGALVSKPTSGATAGGTFLRIFGVGFAGKATVRVGGMEATGVVVHDSTLITAFTPPGDIGTVDVTVTMGGAQTVLPQGFTYYDPTSGYGGTWGEAVDEAVNVTVVDILSNKPVPEAFVTLGAAADTPWTGLTDDNGEITFAGPGLLGRQTVTAVKPNYTAGSVVAFDATNVTVQLYPYIPPSPGGGAGTPLDPGSVSGRVFGLAKYVVVPPGQCANKDTTTSLYCRPCLDPSDCGNPDAVCASVGDQGTFCTTRCDDGQACPEGYACAASIGGEARCLPTAGRKEARCFVSDTSALAGTPDTSAGVVAAADGTFSMPSRLGEVAVVCRGGYVDWDTGTFVPMVMGVLRHVFVTAGQNLPDQEVELTIPLKRRADVRLDSPPFAPKGPNTLLLEVWLDLGTDGSIPMGSAAGSDPGSVFSVERLPLALTDDLYDASYTFWAGSYTNGSGQTPYSVSVERGLTQLGGQAVLVREGGAWEAMASGAEDDLRGVWGNSDGVRWAVGDRGEIVRSDGGTWVRQPSPTRQDLAAIHGAAASEAWAVGSGGTIAHWSGLQWTLEKSPTTKDLRGVFATPDAAWAVGWFTVLRREGAAWAKVAAAPQKDLHAVWAGDDGVWAVGAHGTALRFDGAAWSQEDTPTSATLRGVWGTGGLLVAVGDDGTVLRRDAAGWVALTDVPTTRPLRAVQGRFSAGTLHLWIVGADGLVLHHDGAAWVDESPAGTTTDLNALWVPPGDAAPVAVGTRDLLLGPYMRIPQLVAPPGSLDGATFELAVDGGVDPHFRYISLETAFGLPLWILMVKGDVTRVELPDLPLLAGHSALPEGVKRVRIYSVFKDDFDIDSYDNFDLSLLSWRSWSVAEHPFK